MTRKFEFLVNKKVIVINLIIDTYCKLGQTLKGDTLMMQVKIFCGRSLSIEENINNWLQKNKNLNIVDINFFKGDSFIYALLLYELQENGVNYHGLENTRNFSL